MKTNEKRLTNRRNKFIYSLFAVLCWCAFTWPTGAFGEPSGGVLHIYAFGDSITYGVNSSTKATETFRYLLSDMLYKKYGADVRVYNGGIGGQDTQIADRRFNEVLKADANIVIIMFGSNDASLKNVNGGESSGPRVPVEKYRETIEKWIDALQQKGSVVILMTPPPVARNYQRLSDDKFLSRDQNSVTRQFAYACREIAVKKKVDLVDNFSEFLSMNSGSSSMDKNFISDGIHFNEFGNRVIAENIMRRAFDPYKSRTMSAPGVAEIFKLKNKPSGVKEDGEREDGKEDEEDGNVLADSVRSDEKIDYSAIINANRVNLALNKPYLENMPERGCNKNALTDGEANISDPAKSYFSRSSEIFPKWVVIDLGRCFKIYDIVIYNSGKGETKKIKLLASDNIENFHSIARHSFLKGERHYKLSLDEPEEARYVKIEFSDSYSDDGTVSLNEVEVWGQK